MNINLRDCRISVADWNLIVNRQAMAAPSYNELLIRYQVKSSEMTATIQHPELKKISSELDQWETLGLSLGLGKPDIESIKRCRQKEEYKRKKMLRRWKRKCKDAATYEELARTMLQISRADLAEIVVQVRKSLTEACTYETTTDGTLSPISEFTPRNLEVPQAAPTCIIKDTCGWIEIDADNSIDIHWNRAVRLRRAELTTEIGSLRMNLDFAPSNTKDTEVMAGFSNNELPHELWEKRTTTMYGAHGGRDILIISPKLQDPHQPEAVARTPGNLTDEDKQKLLSQGVTCDCQSEINIIEARWELDKDCKIVDTLKGSLLTREEVLISINDLFNETQNDGASIHYIGAGGRNTGDWCFADGFITFRDITQLYLQSKLRGRVLTIISDCSYSGRWIRECMDFLDKQGVQPCGHKAREKGIIIKVYASCKSIEIPTEYRYSVSGVVNERNSGVITFSSSDKRLESQTTYSIETSSLHCRGETITDVCRLKRGYTWRKRHQLERLLYFVRGINNANPVWYFILLHDDEYRMREFHATINSGSDHECDIRKYGNILESGYGEDPPNAILEEMKQEYERNLY